MFPAKRYSSNQSVTSMKRKTFALNECPVQRSMNILGGKWKPIIIWALRGRTARFGQIAAAIGTISRKVLTSALRELEDDGIVLREQHPDTAQHIEYTLTQKGHDLIPLILGLTDWDKKYYQHVYYENESAERASLQLTT